jgi:hypothetical protein
MQVEHEADAPVDKLISKEHQLDASIKPKIAYGFNQLDGRILFFLVTFDLYFKSRWLYHKLK